MGKPAARIGDMHVCPMVTPGVPPIPHVGGPISGPGVPTVLIGGLPAATMSDMCVCVGPPDSIILGSTGVLIGGKPAARMGDTTVHGGTIAMGLPTVLIGEINPGSPGALKAIVGMFPLLEQLLSPEMNDHMTQTNTMAKAAESGAPFCEICAKMAAEKNSTEP